MGLCTASGVPVSSARVTMQLQGCWVLDLVASDQVAPGPVTVLIQDGLSFKGTAARGGVWLDSDFMRVLPGAGGMGKIAKAKAYRNVTASVIIKDLLGVAGETLSSTSSSKVLKTQFPFYSVNADAVGRCLSAILQDPRMAGATWRSLPDGTVFVGTETWPDSGLLAPAAYQDIDELPHQGRAELGFEAPVLVPGVSLEGRHVGAVEHVIDGEKCRTTVWFNEAASVTDRLKAALYAIVRTALPRLPYAAPRFARVVSSATSIDGTTTMDVIPEDGSFPTQQGVPLFHGDPGERVTIAAGTRVLLEFSGFDPSQPFVRSFAGGEHVTNRRISADMVDVGGAAGDFAAQSTALSVYLKLLAAHVHSGGTLALGLTGPSATIAAPPPIAAKNVKVQ